MRAAGSLAVAVLLAACSGGADDSSPTPSPTPTRTVAAPRALIAADFDPASLGPRIEAVSESDAAIGDGLARLSCYVACPQSMSSCDPATAPDGTPYTYVLTITPGAAASAEEADAASTAPAGSTVAPVEAPAELFRLIRPAPFFNGAVGYSRSEGEAALGRADALTVTLDQNQIIWRVSGGSGWQAGKPITFWWRTTRPPVKGVAAYRLEYGGSRAEVRAPFPAEGEVEN